MKEKSPAHSFPSSRSSLRQYQLPLRLINEGFWQGMNLPARAILPPYGLHSNRFGKCFPSESLILKLSGIKKLDTLRKGLKCLETFGLIEIHKVARSGKQGRSNLYYLKPPAIVRPRQDSYYPMYEDFFISGRWAGLFPSEKSAFGVLAVKATLKPSHYPEKFAKFKLDPDWWGCGTIRGNWYELAGISRRAWYEAVKNLNHRGEILPLSKQGYLLTRSEV